MTTDEITSLENFTSLLRNKSFYCKVTNNQKILKVDKTPESTEVWVKAGWSSDDSSL